MAYISKLRGTKTFHRRPGRKPPRSITLIVCEGETEKVYFEAARIHYELTNTEIIIADNSIGSAPISVVQYAERKWKEPGGYDKIYCVFDRNGHESFNRAREKIKGLAGRKQKALPIQEVISIPCFEIWVLLHFERTDAPFDRCDAVRARIEVNYMSDYDKTEPAIARRLMAWLDRAISYADWLEQRAANNNHNPYTSVHHVIKHFRSVANQEGTP